MTTGYYLLRLNVPEALREMYVAAAQKHNHTIRTEKHYDAGFDLFSPVEVTVAGFTTKALNQGVKGAMEFIGAPPLAVGYYMYPRSSTGSKTPLRLANSVGIIDAGYRGDYIAVFDNWRGTDYQVEKFQRLLQICPPNMTYPMLVEVVDDLGAATLRGTGGFGSSGK